MKYCPLTGMYVEDHQDCNLRLGGIETPTQTTTNGKFSWNTITDILEIGGQIYVGSQQAKNQPDIINNYVTPDNFQTPDIEGTGEKKSKLPYIIGGVAILALVYFLILKK